MREIAFMLFGSALTAIGSIVTVFVRTRARRADLVFERRVERLLELEKLAGHLTEYLGGHAPPGWEEDRLWSEYREMQRMSGSFRRYEAITQAVRNFRNRAGRILQQGGRDAFETREQSEEAVEELRQEWRYLTTAIDEALSDHGVLEPHGARSDGWFRDLFARR